MLIANYRQYNGTSPSCPYNQRSDNDAILRFNDMVNIWNDVDRLNKPTMIVGDLNLDRWEPNNPENRNDIKNIIPILKDFQSNKNKQDQWSQGSCKSSWIGLQDFRGLGFLKISEL